MCGLACLPVATEAWPTSCQTRCRVSRCAPAPINSSGELLFRASRGLPRVAAQLLHRALYEADERNQNFLDDHTLEAAIEQSPVGQVVLA